MQKNFGDQKRKTRDQYKYWKKKNVTMRRQCSKNSFADAGIDVKLCMKIIMEHLVCSLFPFRGVLTIAHVEVWEKRCLQKVTAARWALPWETSILSLRHSNWWTFLLLLSNPCSAFFFFDVVVVMAWQYERLFSICRSRNINTSDNG